MCGVFNVKQIAVKLPTCWTTSFHQFTVMCSQCLSSVYLYLLAKWGYECIYTSHVDTILMTIYDTKIRLKTSIWKAFIDVRVLKWHRPLLAILSVTLVLCMFTAAWRAYSEWWFDMALVRPRPRQICHMHAEINQPGERSRLLLTLKFVLSN